MSRIKRSIRADGISRSARLYRRPPKHGIGSELSGQTYETSCPVCGEIAVLWLSDRSGHKHAICKNKKCLWEYMEYDPRHKNGFRKET